MLPLCKLDGTSGQGMPVAEVNLVSVNSKMMDEGEVQNLGMGSI